MISIDRFSLLIKEDHNLISRFFEEVRFIMELLKSMACQFSDKKKLQKLLLG